MKKITRILSFFLALLLGMSCLTACGGNTQDTQGSGAPSGNPADSGASYNIKIGFMSPNTHPWTTAANEFAEKVKQRTDGKVTVEVFPASTLGNGAELLESTQNGSV